MTRRAPRYAPQTRYRTRRSAAEHEDVDELADTGVDRPVVDTSGITARLPRLTVPPTRSPLAWAPFVIALALAAGVSAGALIALLS